MNKKLKKLFSELDRFWNIVSVPGTRGEHPGCHIVQSEILDELKTMKSEDVISVLKELTDIQMDQIISIVEEIITEFPETAETFIEINSDRDIHWLDDELKLLGII